MSFPSSAGEVTLSFPHTGLVRLWRRQGERTGEQQGEQAAGQPRGFGLPRRVIRPRRGEASLSHAAFLATKQFPGLDGIRAISALLVVSVHLGDNNFYRRWDWLGGGLGVSVFFVLSGFLITTLALREEQDRGRLSLRAFFVRRSFRIFPLYYYVLAVTALLAFSLGGKYAADMRAALPYYVTYMGEFAPGAHFYHSWSLGVEEKFYLLWPILCFGLLWRRRALRLPLAIGIITLPLVFEPMANDRAFNGYSKIITGCALAIALHDRKLYDVLARLVERSRASLSLLCVLGFHLAHGLWGIATPIWHLGHSLSVAYLILACVGSRPPWLALLDCKPLRFVGERSYGIYLVQLLVVPVAGLPFPVGSGSRLIEFTTYFATCACCILVADVLRRLVELPFLNAGRRLSARILDSPRYREECPGLPSQLKIGDERS